MFEPTVVQKVRYSVKCDACGTIQMQSDSPDAEVSLYDTPSQALTCVQRLGWMVFTTLEFEIPQTVICPKCCREAVCHEYHCSAS